MATKELTGTVFSIRQYCHFYQVLGEIILDVRDGNKTKTVKIHCGTNTVESARSIKPMDEITATVIDTGSGVWLDSFIGNQSIV